MDMERHGQTAYAVPESAELSAILMVSAVMARAFCLGRSLFIIAVIADSVVIIIVVVVAISVFVCIYIIMAAFCVFVGVTVAFCRCNRSRKAHGCNGAACKSCKQKFFHF